MLRKQIFRPKAYIMTAFYSKMDNKEDMGRLPEINAILIRTFKYISISLHIKDQYTKAYERKILGHK